MNGKMCFLYQANPHLSCSITNIRWGQDAKVIWWLYHFNCMCSGPLLPLFICLTEFCLEIISALHSSSQFSWMWYQISINSKQFLVLINSIMTEYTSISVWLSQSTRKKKGHYSQVMAEQLLDMRFYKSCIADNFSKLLILKNAVTWGSESKRTVHFKIINWPFKHVII